MKVVEIGMSLADLFVKSKSADKRKWENAHDFGLTMYDLGEDLGEFIVAMFGV